MRETKNETQETSPFQILIHGAWMIQEMTKRIEKSNHDDVQRAVTGEN